MHIYILIEEHHSDDIFFIPLVEFDLLVLVVEAEKTFVTLNFINLTAIQPQNSTIVPTAYQRVDTFITSYPSRL